MEDEICGDFAREVADITMGQFFIKLKDKERAALLKLLLGPIIDEHSIFTPKEIAYYHLHIILGKSAKMIARSFKCTDSNVYAVVASAEKKLMGYRRNRPYV